MALRERDRDAELPARAGDGKLSPPSEAEVVELASAHLRRAEAPAITAARWDYARWKPGVSITSIFTLTFADGSSEPLVVKRFVDGKERTLQFKPRNEEHLQELCARLRPSALVPERSLALWVPPADRVVRGLPVLLDKKSLGNLVTRAGVVASGMVKKRKTEYTLLRYKPERRAVYRVDLRLRDEEKRKLALAARALPPAEAARVIATRTAFEAAGGRALAPHLAATNLRQGFFLEPWLELETFSGDQFGHARAAGELLARLHALPAPTELRTVPLGLPGDLDELFAVDPALVRLPRAAPHPAPRRRVFCHGDFHPDQVARRPDGSWLLMDLDCLATGDPAADLANWAADWIIEHERADLEAATGELLDGYRAAGGTAPERSHLAAHVAAELVNRAGATFRRLEKDAPARARSALEAAAKLAP
jgi:aminoglycoside phosphotransferase (APT) family kinase protein